MDINIIANTEMPPQQYPHDALHIVPLYCNLAQATSDRPSNAPVCLSLSHARLRAGSRQTTERLLVRLKTAEGQQCSALRRQSQSAQIHVAAQTLRYHTHTQPHTHAQGNDRSVRELSQSVRAEPTASLTSPLSSLPFFFFVLFSSSAVSSEKPEK